MTKAFKSAAFVGIALVDSSAAMAGPRPTPIYNWTGFYIGAETGAFQQTDRFRGGLVGNSSASSGLIGAFAGYNYQFSNNIVLGVEGRFDGVDVNPRFGTLDSQTNWTTSLVARLGYAAGNFMPYVSGGGYATNLSQSFPGRPDSNTATGWTLGGGIEFNLTGLIGQPYQTVRVSPTLPPNWILRVDYRHYSSHKALAFGDLHTRTCSDSLVIGFAVKFNSQ
jgi:outer membrane immunogenic protein